MLFMRKELPKKYEKNYENIFDVSHFKKDPKEYLDLRDYHKKAKEERLKINQHQFLKINKNKIF